MTYPKISIIIHCFNRENYIRETLDSILQQEYPNLELIVIDDGSTDKSWEIIKSYGSKISYMEHLQGSRTSPVPALNIGFSKATGDILMWLNTKNILLHKSLFIIGEVFTTLPQVEWMTGLASMIDDRSLSLRILSVYRNKYDFLAGKWEVIQQESTCWRRSLWEKTGGSMDSHFEWAFDIALWVKFFKVAPLYQINTIIGAYRETATSQSIQNRSVFLSHVHEALKEQWTGITAKERMLYYLYRLCYALRIFLRIIPDSIFGKIPFLHIYGASIVRYSKIKEKWEPEARIANPFHKF
jgi:glycosyltransferase involved in cell wall biosynthesis